MSENINEKVDPSFEEELKILDDELELVDDEFEDDLCGCDGIIIGFDGDYDDLLTILYHSENAYIQSKIDYEKQECDLWLNTEWENVFEKKPTQKDKEMFVKQSLVPLKSIRDFNKAKYENFKRMYELSLKYTLEVLR